MANWMHKMHRETKLGAPFPVPTGYGATERSRTHVLVGDNITLCQHRQSDEKSKRLVSPMTSDNVSCTSAVDAEAPGFKRGATSIDLWAAKDILAKLGDNFGWDEAVVTALVNLGIESLQEFRFLWATEGAVETWVTKLGIGDKTLLQTARVRRAWAAVGLYYRQAEQDRSKIQLSDLDTMLGETELRDTKQQFWRRYKLRFSPEVHPADTTISRVAREMQKRMLCVYSIWKVKSLQFQLTTSQKKRKVGESLFVEEGEDEESCSHDYDNYLDKLYTLMLAYAMAGCAGVTGAPEAAQELNLGADTTKFVLVPLDVVFKYFFRAKRSSAMLPPAARLQWLQARDLDERSEWVAKFRDSTSTLGQIIQDVFTARDAHWLPSTTSTSTSKAAAGPSPSAASLKSPQKPTSPSTSQLQMGKPIQGKAVAVALKDGTKLCAQFQHGNCKAKNCPNGAVEQAHSLPQSAQPLMADLMAGPGAPLTRAFIACGWQCITVDWLLDPGHDLSDERRQHSLSEQLQDVHFIAAALDCSTKSRAREIPRIFQDGRPAPSPLRSEAHPDGLPTLEGRDALRVQQDNKACAFVLDEIQSLHERGGSVRENPYRSLHWWGSQESAMWDSGEWWETPYSACSLGGARCKHQLLRHNIEEIHNWPPAACHHTHRADEWTPYTAHGQHVYPSKEEAEYTAVLAYAIAVSASWWAARMSLAKLHVPRMPPFHTVGRREHWLDIDPRALREWAMVPLAVSLGLTAALQGRPGLPVRATVEAKQVAPDQLASGCVYVGRGSFHHRLQTTKWKAPWTPGHNCDTSEWLSLYVQHIRTSNLWEQLEELKGCTLVCDCPLTVLVGLFFDATSPSRATRASPRANWQRTVMLLQGIQSIPKAMSLPMMSQETLVLAFRKLFPADWFDNYQFAMVEDLINAPPFSCFPQWLASRGEAWAGPLGPHLAAGSVRQLARIGEGQQVGAVAHRAALPPLLPFNLSPDAHFQQALQRAQQPLPFEDLPVVDSDLRFVASMYSTHKASLRALRRRAVGAMKELQRRWSGVTTHLRSFQEPEVRVVTQQRDIGLLALLLVLTSWADTSLPFGLVKGLPAVGYAPPYGIFPQQPARRLSMDDDATNGFCTFPLTSTQLQKQIQGQAHCLIPRCVITQSSGKQRVIDNGDTGGQSELSSDANKLTLCSPLRPAQHIALVMHEWSLEEQQHFHQDDHWETGQEDLPSAYRFCPMSRGESLGCVVVWWHHEWQAPAFQLYTGLLFGLPLAVTSFNRLSRVLESLSRRLGYVLVSFYFDDATITDWAMGRQPNLQAGRVSIRH
eukprot:s1905_g8.t1